MLTVHFRDKVDPKYTVHPYTSCNNERTIRIVMMMMLLPRSATFYDDYLSRVYVIGFSLIRSL